MISGTCGTHVYVIPRRLKITCEFQEPQESFPLSLSCLQHRSTTVPLHTFLCSCSQEYQLLFLILRDLIRTPLDRQTLTEERDLGDAARVFPLRCRAD